MGTAMSKQKLRISNSKGVDISKGMIGLFFEDINYSADGGLYAEMIENRNFEFLKSSGDYNNYFQSFDGLYGWSGYPSNSRGAVLELKTQDPVNENNPHYLSFTSTVSQMAFTNKAYDGITVKKGMYYRISCYIRSLEDYEGHVEVSIYKSGESKICAILAGSVSKEWKKYEAVVKASEEVVLGDFVIELSLIGNVEFDFISMMPEDAVKSIFRKDIFQLLQDMKPGFIRFPGGCVIEGNNLENRYKWKDSVGPVEGRRLNWNRWAVHENSRENNFTNEYCHYNQTLGLGYYEYFILCENLKAKAIPVVNVGLACQYQSKELIKVDSDEFNEYIKDTLDLIEFANGSDNTTWGRVRSEMGHPEPFGLDMLGIGNEQWETDKVDFFKRYRIFEQEIHSRYPEMKLIGSAGPDVISDHYFEAWEFYQNNSGNVNFTYAVDEHYYQSTDWLYNNVHFYDKYPRNIKVFSGEYAAHVSNGMNNPKANTLGAALAEAAFLTGIEHNADVVVLASYAPLLARTGYAQWSPDLIWFNDRTAYGTPSYYVQKLYGNNMGAYTIESKLEGYNQKLYQTVSFDTVNHDIIIKLVNASDKLQLIELELNQEFSINEDIKVSILRSDHLDDINSIDQPANIVPIETVLNIGTERKYNAPAYSLSVIRITVI